MKHGKLSSDVMKYSIPPISVELFDDAMTIALHSRHHCVHFGLVVVIVVVAKALFFLPALIKLDCKDEKEEKVGSSQLLRYNPQNKTVESQYLYLPRRLLTVFGLESSGTTFVTELLERSTGVKHSVPKNFHDYQLQHVSLPSGEFCQGRIHIIPVLYPAICGPSDTALASRKKKHSSRRFVKCPESLDALPPPGDKYAYPTRYFVNITSHIHWYRDRGVNATAVLVIRDKTIGSMARSLVHCFVPEFQQKEEETGTRIMMEAMEHWAYYDIDLLVPPPIVVVSYETLVHMGAPYLNSILRQLQLPAIHESLEWAFEDGNARYIQTREQHQAILALNNPTRTKPPSREENDDEFDERSMGRSFQTVEPNASENDDNPMP